MVVQEKHIQSKRRIGTLKGEPVIEVVTTGGLHMVAVQKNGKPFICGAGPHRAVARHLAQKAEKDMVLFELSKSEQVDPAALASIAPKYEALVQHLNGLIG